MIEDDYQIVSVRPVEPPSEMDGPDWHCYVIAQGENTIRGYRQGKIEAVTESIEQIVARLNERRIGKRGRVHLDMTARGSSARRN
jgi:hypothetical protein